MYVEEDGWFPDPRYPWISKSLQSILMWGFLEDLIYSVCKEWDEHVIDSLGKPVSEKTKLTERKLRKGNQSRWKGLSYHLHSLSRNEFGLLESLIINTSLVTTLMH